jgi:hypothetical protein
MDYESDSEFDILSKWLMKQLPCLTCHEIQQYVNKLIKDGWNNVDFIEDKLDGEKCLDFMLAAHKQVLMKRLNEIRERRADGQKQVGTPSIPPSRMGDVDGKEAESLKTTDKNSKNPSAAASDNELERYMSLLKYDKHGKEALKTYKEWSESGCLLKLAEKRLDDVMVQIDPHELADLSKTFPIRQYGLDLAMIFLTPLAARPKPICQHNRPSPHISSHDDTGKSDHKMIDSYLRSASHLRNIIIQVDYQSKKNKVTAFTIIMASAFMVPTVVITDKVSLLSNLRPKIQRIVRELLGDTGTFADNNIFFVTNHDEPLLNYTCMAEGFCPKAISSDGAALVIRGCEDEIQKAREMIEFIELDHYCLLVCEECGLLGGISTDINASGEFHELLQNQLLGIIILTTVPE